MPPDRREQRVSIAHRCTQLQPLAPRVERDRRTRWDRTSRHADVRRVTAPGHRLLELGRQCLDESPEVAGIGAQRRGEQVDVQSGFRRPRRWPWRQYLSLRFPVPRRRARRASPAGGQPLSKGMLRQGIKARAALALVAALAVIAVVVVVLSSGSGSPARPAAAAPTRTVAAVTPTPAASLAYGPPPLARYKEAAPHVASTLSVYGVQGQVTGAPATPAPEQPPLSPASFTRPRRRVPRLQRRSADDDGRRDRHAPDRARRRRPRRRPGRVAGRVRALPPPRRGLPRGSGRHLDQAIDGNPGGLPGGVSPAVHRPASDRVRAVDRRAAGGALCLFARSPPTSSTLATLLPTVPISRSTTRPALTRSSRTPSAICSAAPTCRGAARACWAPRRLGGDPRGDRDAAPLLERRATPILPVVDADLAALVGDWPLARAPRTAAGFRPTGS